MSRLIDVTTVEKMPGLPIPLEFMCKVSALFQLPTGPYKIISKEYIPSDVIELFRVENEDDGDGLLRDGTILRIDGEIDDDLKIVVNAVYYNFSESQLIVRGTLVSRDISACRQTKEQKVLANELLDDLVDYGYHVATNNGRIDDRF